MDNQTLKAPKRRSYIKSDSFCLLVQHEHDINSTEDARRTKERETLIAEVTKSIQDLYKATDDDPIFRDLRENNIRFSTDNIPSFKLPNTKPVVSGNITLLSLVSALWLGGQNLEDEERIRERKGHLLASMMELQNRINNVQPSSDSPVQIKAVSPNWMVAAGQGLADGGGPGARPTPPDPDKLKKLTSGNRAAYQFLPSDSSTPWWQAGSPVTKVIVGILDASPTPEVFAHAQKALTNGTPPFNNALLKDMIGSTLSPRTTPQGNMLDTGWLHILYGIDLPPENYVTRGHDYLMPDHGLFVSGIIGSLVDPNYADLYLVEVLNQHGCGTLSSIISGLSRFWEYVQDPANEIPEGTPIVVNASLRFDTPVTINPNYLDESALQALEKEELFQAHKKVRNPNLNGKDFAQFVWQSLDVFRMILFQSARVPGGVLSFWRDDIAKVPNNTPRRLLIAAAGNDHERNNAVMPQAGYPAAEDDAVGVGALARDRDFAKYSNQADLPQSVGFYTMGGDAPAQPYDSAGNQIAEASKTDKGNGIAGLYLGEFPDDAPMTGINDTQGWAEWAGTSFATPIISGIATSLIQRGQSPMQQINGQCATVTLPDGTVTRRLYISQG